MILSAADAHAKLEKFASSSDTFQFALSPSGFLLVSHGKVFEVADFTLIYDDHFYIRKGFDFSTNMTVSDRGLYLCSVCNGKFIAKYSEESFEFATHKKPLTDSFSLLISMRFAGKIVLFIADGKFSNEFFFITLLDTLSNEAFASALLRNLVSTQHPDIAELLVNKEEKTNGEEV